MGKALQGRFAADAGQPGAESPSARPSSLGGFPIALLYHYFHLYCTPSEHLFILGPF